MLTGKLGDVVGVYFDTTNDFIAFTLNGKPLGIAWKNFIDPKHSYYFAVSISTEAEVEVLWDSRLPTELGDPRTCWTG